MKLELCWSEIGFRSIFNSLDINADIVHEDLICGFVAFDSVDSITDKLLLVEIDLEVKKEVSGGNLMEVRVSALIDVVRFDSSWLLGVNQ